MKFMSLPRIFPDKPLYGTRVGAFTFVISEDGADGFTASAKVMGDDVLHNLGGYAVHKSLADAQQACETFYRNRNA